MRKQITGGIVAIDVNGPLRDHHEACRRCLEVMEGLIIPRDQFTGKDIIGKIVFQHRTGDPRKARTITLSNWERMKHLLLETPWFYWFSPQTLGALETVNRLSDLNYRIWIVSSIGGLVESKVKGCLAMHRIPHERVILTRGEPKTPYYEESDVVIDNELPHLLPVASGERITIQLCPRAAAHARKKGANPHPHILAVASWREAEPYLFH